MYVCLCASVTVSDVRASAASGAETVEEVGKRCSAGTGCGSCRDHIQAILDGHPDHLDHVFAYAQTA